jgi:outer membrane protein assembly factor BamA
MHDTRMSTVDAWGGTERIRNQVYTRRHESVIGIAGALNRSGPYPDPDYGWRIIPVQEFGGRFLGGDRHFWRSNLELNNYILVWPKHNHKVATRVKGGLGGPSDDDLYQLGGADDLRGYGSKSIPGSRMLLTGLEYRLPLARSLAMPTPGNFVNLDTVQLVGFYDGGKAWFNDYSAARFLNDIGLGLRLHFDTIGFLEKTVIRFDAAYPLNGRRRSTHYWLSVNQTF